jgi:uncharacterized protein YndB with AHSA1/START domain
MVRKVLLVLVLLIAGLAFYANGQPDSFSIRRSTEIAAPPATVHGLINDFRAWSRWSPWEFKDPAMTREYGANTVGPGAMYSWSGNAEVGTGTMTITDSVPGSRVAIRLEFTEPMADTSNVEFTLAPASTGGTRVEWTMSGENNFVSKLMSVFISMDAMVGPDFEAGLAKLKTAAEGSASP